MYTLSILLYYITTEVYCVNYLYCCNIRIILLKIIIAEIINFATPRYYTKKNNVDNYRVQVDYVQKIKYIFISSIHNQLDLQLCVRTKNGKF